MQQALAVAQGLAAVQGDAALPLAWFDALAGSDEEALRLQFDANAQRALNRARRELWGK